MALNQFLAGVGRALLFDGDNLIGVAKTLTESTFNFSISNEEIRGGQGNALFGKYFHDSNLAITLVDAMFKLEYLAANLGVDISMGGLSVYESSAAGEVVGAGGIITLSNTPTMINGSLLAWYKKPADANWNVATINVSGKDYTIDSSGLITITDDTIERELFKEQQKVYRKQSEYYLALSKAEQKHQDKIVNNFTRDINRQAAQQGSTALITTQQGRYILQNNQDGQGKVTSTSEGKVISSRLGELINTNRELKSNQEK